MSRVESATPHRPPCQLTERDGNVLSVIGAVRRALRADGQPDRAAEFVKRAFAAGSYDEVLALTFEYVEVE